MGPGCDCLAFALKLGSGRGGIRAYARDEL